MTVDLTLLQPILSETSELSERFEAAGHTLYLVGGLVRDVMAGRPLDNDIDLTTDAEPEETKALLAGWADALWTQGERFGTIGCTHNGMVIEITTHRAEFYDPASRKPRVRFSRAIEADLSRRDFTVNAMAIRLPDGELIDPFGGGADLAAGVLRTPGEPTLSFGDDPLRMLRAARFHAGYGLRPSPEVEMAMAAMGERLEIVSAERVRDELDKLLVLEDPVPGLDLLDRTGLMGRIVPAYGDESCPAGPHWPGVVGRMPPSARLRRSAFFVRLWRCRGEGGLRSELGRLRWSRADQAGVERLLGALERVMRTVGDRDGVGGWTDSDTRHLAALLDGDLESLAALVADEAFLGPDQGAVLRSRWQDLAAREDLSRMDIPLSGSDVMSVLGIGPGEEVGRAIGHLKELRLARGPMSRDEAELELQRWFTPD